MSIATSSFQELVERVSRIDFGRIKEKFINGSDGLSWSLSKYDIAEQNYRQFLVINALYLMELLVPSADVDEIWHMHILDTQAYLRDCHEALGFFLHHVPAQSGDKRRHEESFQRTQILQHRHFPELTHQRNEGGGKCSRCSGGRCKSLESSGCPK